MMMRKKRRHYLDILLYLDKQKLVSADMSPDHGINNYFLLSHSF